MLRKSWGASLCLHILLILFFLWAPKHFDWNSNYEGSVNKIVQVHSMNEKEFADEMAARKKLQDTGQVVQMDEKLRSEEPPTDTNEKIYLSKFNQRADRNTRAATVGNFKNVLKEGTESGSEISKEIAEGSKGQKTVAKKAGLAAVKADPSRLFAIANPDASGMSSESMRAPASILKKAGGQSGAQGGAQGGANAGAEGRKGDGISATDDFLENTAIGTATMLNTNEFKYFSFYDRVRQQLVDRWRSRIRKEIARAPASTGAPLSLGSKITRLEVKLDKNGNVISIDKVGLSGIESFDEAAVISFREGGPYPHPPEEMLKDGVVTIQWDFAVVVEQASMIKFDVDHVYR